MPDRLDVLIVGGGPAGATVGALLRRYAPGLEVGIVERERFPRHHVGESQLPAVSAVLDEMGAWDAVEAAGFPIKVGATFSWGRDAESWDFDFLPADAVGDPARPGRYEGVRRSTAFQVDRARYDEILLRHAAARGCHVEEGQGVRAVERSGDRIDAVVMEDGTRRRARHYVDASGSGAVLRRGLGIGAQQPTALRHSALYAYWRDADWAVRIGTSATRIQVRSLPYGWLWFIPLGTDRTSVGLVVPTAWLRGRRSSPETLYEEAVRADSEIASLLGRARREGELRAVRDWSHRAERVVGENWIVVGDAAGFADPILSAGMTLAHTSARNAACHLLEIDRGEHETDWLRARYQDRTCRTVDQHLRFARYWYAANGCFDDLQAHCREIAAEGGLDLAPEAAWAWLASGGFAASDPLRPQAGSFDLHSARMLVGRFSGTESRFAVQSANHLRLDLSGCRRRSEAVYAEGRVRRIPVYERGGRVLPAAGLGEIVLEVLRRTEDVNEAFAAFHGFASRAARPEDRPGAMAGLVQVLEAAIAGGFVEARQDPNRAPLGWRFELGRPRR